MHGRHLHLTASKANPSGFKPLLAKVALCTVNPAPSPLLNIFVSAAQGPLEKQSGGVPQETGSLPGLELTDLERIAGRRAPGILLSLPLCQIWDYRHVLRHLAFIWVLGLELKSASTH